MEQPTPPPEERSTIPLGAWIALGAGIGVALGAALHNLALGIGMGVAIGTAQVRQGQ